MKMTLRSSDYSLKIYSPGTSLVVQWLKNPPFNVGDNASILDQGNKIPHTAGQLSPGATTTEPVHPRACVLQQEKPVQCKEDQAQPRKKDMLPNKVTLWASRWTWVFGGHSFLIAQKVKNLPVMQKTWVWFLSQDDLLEKEWQPILLFLPGESHRQRSLVSYSPWGCKESDKAEWLTLSLFSVQYRRAKPSWSQVLRTSWVSRERWMPGHSIKSQNSSREWMSVGQLRPWDINTGQARQMGPV